MIPRQKVYDTYWKFAYERQEIFFKKYNNLPPPYTSDPILTTYKFCNVYRASDRVSQFLIKNVIYDAPRSVQDTIFRIFLFRLINRNETWQKLEEMLGEISLVNFSFDRYNKALTKIAASSPIYGNAFILCANKFFGYSKKHQNHLALLKSVFLKDKISKDILNSNSLLHLFENLRSLPLIGNFMAYQLAIDFNYSKVFDFDEDDFTCAGPGAIRGIQKCFLDFEGKTTKYVIKFMVDHQEKEFKRLGLNFKTLWGRRLHAIDCQGLFCETDKYCRAGFPELKSNRMRIKAKYKPVSNKINYFYPPKWKINELITHPVCDEAKK